MHPEPHDTTKPRKLTLDTRVLCANCDSQMRNTGRRYYCPNTTVESGGKCSTRPLDAEQLLRSVVTRMTRHLATEEFSGEVVRDIRNSIDENTRIQRRVIEQAQAAIAQATARNGALPRPETQDNSITALDVDTAGPTFQIMVAQEELKKLEFIGDETRLRETLSDPETYMRANGQEDAQELLDLLIRAVRVDNRHTTILYNLPMPVTGHPEGILAEQLTP